MDPRDELRKNILRRRGISPIQALDDAIVSTGVLLMATAIDTASVLMLIGAFVRFTSDQPGALWYCLPIVVNFILGTFFGGLSIGKLVFNVRYAHEYEFRFFRRMDYIEYLMESFFSRFKYNDYYEMFEMYFSSRHQSPPMKEYGMIFVFKRKFIRVRNDYRINGHIFDPTKKGEKGTILGTENTHIFHDE